jgi:hypothetical protein
LKALVAGFRPNKSLEFPPSGSIRRQLEDFMLAFSGQRLALDRDGDGAFDGDELSEGTDPADPASHP